MKVINQIAETDYGSSLEPSLREIEREFKVNLTIHDLKGRLHKRDGQPLLPGRNVHQHPCCMRGRYEFPDWNLNCGADCFAQTEQKAAQLHQPFIKVCWKGIAELVVPVFLRDQHLISILAGTFRHPDGVPENAQLPEWFYEEYEKLPSFNLEKLERLSKLLQVVGNGLVIWKERQVTAGPQSDRKLLIYQFVEDHSHEAVSLTDLGKAMGVSPSRARHLVKELTNRSFKVLLNEERMIRARYLLESTIHSLQYIAETVGFKNEFYFNRAFKSYFGEPPGRFRQKARLQRKT